MRFFGLRLAIVIGGGGLCLLVVMTKYQTMQRFRPLCDSYILIVISQHVSRTLYTNRYRLHGCTLQAVILNRWCML